MLSKILVTLAVIIGAFLFIRHQQVADKKEDAQPTGSAAAGAEKAGDDSLAADLRLGAYLFLALMVGLGAALYYFRWQDDHSVLTVNLYRENQVEPITYQVYKYQLHDRSFITIDGTTVTVAGSERMEVTGID